MNILVLYGGWSSERKVSLISGIQCYNVLREKGYQVSYLDVTRNIAIQLSNVQPRPDIIFNALHGKWGEDGTIQGILEYIGIPYTHSGVCASAIAMDKILTKSIVMQYGIPCAQHMYVTQKLIYNGQTFSPPYVLKPINEGSSIGIKIILTKKDEINMLSQKWKHSLHLMQEKFIPGKEITVPVRDGKAMEIIEIIISDQSLFYDFYAKYSVKGSKYIIPANVSNTVRKKIKNYAEIIYQSLHCRGIIRVDFRYDQKNDRIIFLEINTQPGMTPTSLVPKSGLYEGLNFGDMVTWILKDASCNR